MTPAAELDQIAVEIADLGEKIERKRARVLELVKDAVALTRRGQRYRIDYVKVYQGGSEFRIFLEGPLLKKDGKPHACTRVSSPIALLAKLSRDGA